MWHGGSGHEAWSDHPALAAPAIMLFDGQRGDEAQHAGFVREDVHDVSAATDLAVVPFEGIGRAQAQADILPIEDVARQRGRIGIEEPLGSAGTERAQLRGEALHPLRGFLARRSEQASRSPWRIAAPARWRVGPGRCADSASDSADGWPRGSTGRGHWRARGVHRRRHRRRPARRARGDPRTRSPSWPHFHSRPSTPRGVRDARWV